MAGFIRKAVRQTISAGYATGYVHVTSTDGFYKGAKGSIARTFYPDTNRDIEITEVNPGPASTLGVRFVRGLGEGSNYGRDDMSDYNVSDDRIYFDTLTQAFMSGSVVTGTDSLAVATIDSISLNDDGVSGYLVLTGITGTFEAGEIITDAQLVPGSATATTANVTSDSVISCPKQFIYNPNR